MKTLRIAIGISGLGYGGTGASDVEKALEMRSGVLRAYVNPATEMAYVEYDPARVNPAELAKAVQSVGFGVEGQVPLG